METIKEFCDKLGISKTVYYKLAHKLKRRPNEEDVEKHKKTAKNGRPRKESF